MDIKSGLPFWLVKNGLLADFPKLDQNLEKEEVVIIGSGISGALTAHELCEAGFKCTIIDKRLVSSGSTWASTAQIQYEVDQPLYQLSEKIGEKPAVQSYQAILQSIPDLKAILEKCNVNADFTNKESIYLASDKSGLKSIDKEFKMREKHQVPVRFLEKQTLINDYAIDRDGALWNDCAAELDSYKAAAGIILHHVQNGNLKVFTRTNVVSFKPVNNGWTLKTADDITIQTKFLICAAGYEASDFLPKQPFKIKSTYALVTQPLAEKRFWKNKCLIWETARPYFYMRTTPDNRIMMGGGDIPFKNPTLRDFLLQMKTNYLLEKCTELFPRFTDIQADFYWCGSFAETEDSLPLIGEYPGQKNLYYALGYGGNGTTFSVIAAQVIRNILTGKTDERKSLFGFDRF